MDDEDPDDQKSFLHGLEAICADWAASPPATALEGPSGLRRALLRAAALGALSGRPEVLAHASFAVSDEQLLDALRSLCCVSGGPFFRGGQRHGPLAKTGVPNAFGRFLSEQLDDHDACVASLVDKRGLDRAVAMRAFFDAALATGRVFKARQYFAKRLTEFVILASRSASCLTTRDATGSLSMEVEDVDSAADKWPVGSGTLAATQRIFTSVRGERQAQQAIRVIQRALGGCKRRVAFKTVSAMLCFWKRCCDGSLSWKW
jgi:hypothetical protein